MKKREEAADVLASVEELSHTETTPRSGERRVQRRTAISLPVRFQADAATLYAGTARDVSIGGLFIESETQPEFGSELEITIQLSDGAEITLPGVVRWSTKRGFGVQFGLLGAKQTSAIVQLVWNEVPRAK